MDLPKEVLALGFSTIKSWCVVTDKLVKMWGKNGRVRMQIRIIGSWLTNCRELTKGFPKIFQVFSGNFFWSDSHKIGFRVTFYQFFENFATT